MNHIYLWFNFKIQIWNLYLKSNQEYLSLNGEREEEKGLMLECLDEKPLGGMSRDYAFKMFKKDGRSNPNPPPLQDRRLETNQWL